jgi:predicted flap endonuclease-1-like 5' DNA nuclease
MNIKDTQIGSPEGVYAPEPRVYELGYILSPNVSEGSLSIERDALVALITKFKGIVISESQPQLIDLAYEMDKIINNKRQKYTQGYFGWIKFDVGPNHIESLSQQVEELAEMIRFIMIKTIRENTITSDVPFKLARENNSIDEDEEYEDTDEEEAEAPQDPAVKVVAETVTANTPSPEQDDLTKIEGIGEKIAEVFANNGIKTFSDLSAAKVGDLRTILADNDLSQHEPKTWSKQATLAKNAKWDELETLQKELDGGRE